MNTSPLRPMVVSSAIALVLACGNRSVSALPIGLLDPSFNLTGKVETPVGTGASHDVPNSIMALPGDKVLVAGTCTLGSVNSFCLVRYETTGGLDTSFGTGGRALRSVLGNDTAYAAARQPDGKIVMVGGCVSGITTQFCIARFSENGDPDSSFGNGTGYVTVNFPLTVTRSARALAIQPDGRLVVAGRCLSAGTQNDVCIARLLGDGQLDSSFNPLGTQGRVVIPRGPADTANQYATGVAVHADGRIVVVGYDDNEHLVLRVAANGTQPDAAFGTGGWVSASFGPISRAFGVALQPNGKIVVAGICGVLCVARFRENGNLDTTFRSTGVYYYSEDPDLSSLGAAAVVLRSDGAVVLAGFSNQTAATCARTAVVVSSHGTTMGRAGVIGSCDRGYSAVGLYPDGRIIAASATAASNADFGVDRFFGGDNDFQQCSLDIDGDGDVTATVDSLIHTRIALGIRGNSVIAGISFPLNAKRNDWQDVSTYLQTQCGMSVY